MLMSMVGRSALSPMLFQHFLKVCYSFWMISIQNSGSNWITRVNKIKRFLFCEVFLNTELGRDMQDMRIRKKKRQNIRPLQGSLFLTKTSGVAKIPLKDAVNGKVPARCPPEQVRLKDWWASSTSCCSFGSCYLILLLLVQLYRYGVHRQVSGITSETAESFRFDLLHFFKQDVLIDEGGVKIADGGCLIPSKDGTAGKEEFFRYPLNQ